MGFTCTVKYGSHTSGKNCHVKLKRIMTNAVSIMKRRQIVGHVPRSISRAYAVHLKSHGVVTCTVTGGREYSSDLEQGGLQIPVLY